MTAVFGMGTGIASPPWPPGANNRVSGGGAGRSADAKQAPAASKVLAAGTDVPARKGTGKAKGGAFMPAGTAIWSSLTTY